MQSAGARALAGALAATAVEQAAGARAAGAALRWHDWSSTEHQLIAP